MTHLKWPEKLNICDECLLADDAISRQMAGQSSRQLAAKMAVIPNWPLLADKIAGHLQSERLNIHELTSKPHLSSIRYRMECI